MTNRIKTKKCSGCGHAVVADALHCPRCLRKLGSRWPRIALGVALVLVTAGSGWALMPGSQSAKASTVSR